MRPCICPWMALHLSVDERVTIQDYMSKIAHELNHPIDKFSKPLIISNIEVLLNYCMRFYERQFITREELNNDVLVRCLCVSSGCWMIIGIPAWPSGTDCLP